MVGWAHFPEKARRTPTAQERQSPRKFRRTSIAQDKSPTHAGARTQLERFQWYKFVCDRFLVGVDPESQEFKDATDQQWQAKLWSENFLANLDNMVKVGHFDGYDSPGLRLCHKQDVAKIRMLTS